MQVCLALGILVKSTLHLDGNTEPILTFAVLGDWGLAGDNMQKSVASAMSDWVEQNNASFVIGTGDNFYPIGVASVDDPQFDTNWRDVSIAIYNNERSYMCQCWMGWVNSDQSKCLSSNLKL